MKKGMIATYFLTALFLVSCVTVNIYFPAAAVQKAADVIVEDVVKDKPGEPAPEQKPEAPKPQSRLYDFIKEFSFGVSTAYAQEVDIKISTPAIRALRDTLRERFQQIKPFFEKGAVGQNNKGYLEMRDVSGLSLKEKAELNRAVDLQNKERRALYEEIVRANKLGADAVPKVEGIFADSWRDRSRPGWWIQKNDGAWVKK